MSDEQGPKTYTKATVYVEGRPLATSIKVRVGDLVSIDGNGNVVKAQPGQPIVGTITATLAEVDASAWFRSVMVVSPTVMERLQAGLDAASREADRVRRENAEARERWRERVIRDLDWFRERPCASCGLVASAYICLPCSTGLPQLRTWRITRMAAERIRAKAHAARFDPVLPLP